MDKKRESVLWKMLEVAEEQLAVSKAQLVVLTRIEKLLQPPPVEEPVKLAVSYLRTASTASH